MLTLAGMVGCLELVDFFSAPVMAAGILWQLRAFV
jgi:hypothetical protein